MQPEPQQTPTDQALPQNPVDQQVPAAEPPIDGAQPAPAENPEQLPKLDPALAQPTPNNKPVTKTAASSNYHATIAIAVTVIVAIALAVVAIYAYKKG